MWYEKEDGLYMVHVKGKTIVVRIGTSANGDWLKSMNFEPHVYRTMSGIGRSCSPSEVKDGEWERLDLDSMWRTRKVIKFA